MRRVLLALPLVLAACGSSTHRTAPPAFTVHSYGAGATRAWVFEPSTPPKLVVVFVHGLGGQKETTPALHRPWLAHLAREGFEVVYPAYEATPLQRHAMKHLVEGVANAAPHLAKNVPVAAIGYSRGGRLVVDFASIASVTGVVPTRIFSVFPAGTMDAPLDLTPLDGHAKVLIVAGDEDRTVANVGANQLIGQLAIAGFPYGDVHFEVIRSHGFFVADHTSVFDDSPAAQKAFWARADRFFAPLLVR